jgi:hypothetical protein
MKEETICKVFGCYSGIAEDSSLLCYIFKDCGAFWKFLEMKALQSVKHWESLVQWHGIISQKTWILKKLYVAICDWC